MDEQPPLKKRKVGIDTDSKTENLKEGDEKRETTPKETATKKKTTPKETNVSDVLERLMKCFRKGRKKLAKAGLLFEKLVNSSMNEINSSLFLNALDEAMRDRSLWTDSALAPILSRMVRAVSKKTIDNENVRAYHMAVCVASLFLTDDSFEYSGASKHVISELQNRKPDENRAATIVRDDITMQEALVTALSQAFKQCRGFKAFRVSFKAMIEEAQKVRGTFQEETRRVLDQLSEKFYKLLNEFYKKTGCPILVNTSFNIRGEPIVNTPEDAFKCFMGNNLDVLVIDNFFLLKEKQDKSLVRNYKSSFELD